MRWSSTSTSVTPLAGTLLRLSGPAVDLHRSDVPRRSSRQRGVAGSERRECFHRPGCVAAYRPDFVLDDRAGWFRDTCYPFTYDMTGHVVDVWITPPISLDRLAVEVRNGTVYVNPREITPGRSRALEGYAVQSGGTLMPAQYYSRRPETAVRTHRGAEPRGCAERSVPRQPEPARRDDVALDLRGATGDGLRHRKHVLARRPGRHRRT